mmetsp:Transcript_28378/g.33613  ORF Transcript_28378/g.33613 Transcript_28378/m.33613 type:complete len:220 (-) Transcript_28378:276-935(-)|eukprot:CAMPEP_0198248450 /NCGR_PEP_ID=MMETSP1447-20131203/202_1 /TAXON_ID=420782 /ORGANISM="Chaetoceros dichaeta, Strain CCMP1751" /LENGTH=219 /DNA_ID=CAMNT_0043932835 /DNA_START=162 /DNA_END=821 /DNA_ORIENTATION=-
MSSNRYYTSTILSSVTTAAITITTIASSYYITRKISQYGLTGSLRLLWEGDHLPPNIRNAIDALDDLSERKIPKQGRKLDKIDCTIQLAKLNSVDDDDDDDDDTEHAVDNESVNTSTTTNSASTSTTNNTMQTTLSSGSSTTTSSSRRRHYILSQTPQVSKELSSLSYNLDKLAAEVDAIQSHGDAEVKRRKKALSTLLVQMMERVDGFILECGVVVAS